MSDINDGGSAFPMYGMDFRNGQAVESIYQTGMTLRDYFAAKALQGMIADGSLSFDLKRDASLVATSAYQLADAMLEARSGA